MADRLHHLREARATRPTRSRPRHRRDLGDEVRAPAGGAARSAGPARSSSGSARASPRPARRCGRCAAAASTPGGWARATTRCRSRRACTRSSASRRAAAAPRRSPCSTRSTPRCATRSSTPTRRRSPSSPDAACRSATSPTATRRRSATPRPSPALGMIADAWDGGAIDAGWHELPDAVPLDRGRPSARARPSSPRPSTARTTADFVGAGPVGRLGRGRRAAVPRGRPRARRGHEHAPVPARLDGVGGRRRARAVRRRARARGGDARSPRPGTASSSSSRRSRAARRRTCRSSRCPQVPPSQRADARGARDADPRRARSRTLRGVEIEEFVFHNADTKVDGASGRRDASRWSGSTSAARRPPCVVETLDGARDRRRRRCRPRTGTPSRSSTARAGSIDAHRAASCPERPRSSPSASARRDSTATTSPTSSPPRSPARLPRVAASTTPRCSCPRRGSTPGSASSPAPARSVSAATRTGDSVITGGWGWVIGDEAGAAGIVREATKAALLAHDDGAPDDGLLAALLAAFGVADAERLARAVNDEPDDGQLGAARPGGVRRGRRGLGARGDRHRRGGRHLAALVGQLVAPRSRRHATSSRPAA